MNILVTGADGMAASALVRNLEALRDGKNRTRPGLSIEKIFLFTRKSTDAELAAYAREADFVFHFAGVNRPDDPAEFVRGNVDLTAHLLGILRGAERKAGVMLASSVQATLAGRFGDSTYGRSKRAAEELVFAYGRERGVKAAVYRFPNLLGHSRPNYNSAVSTFCDAAANGRPFTVHDRSTTLELLAIDDLVEGMFDLLEEREAHCEYDGVCAVPTPGGAFCHVPTTYTVTLGEIADLLTEFRQQSETLLMPKMPAGSFAKKLFSLYLTYLPKEKMAYALCPHADERGSFTELMHTADCGQVSVNISRPGVTKGEHWHNGKWEQFIVVHGRALIRERNITTGETVEFEVSGDAPQSVYMLPGWTHSITNLSDTDDLVTVMTCNEIFDPQHPDTFREEV